MKMGAAMEWGSRCDTRHLRTASADRSWGHKWLRRAGGPGNRTAYSDFGAIGRTSGARRGGSASIEPPNGHVAHLADAAPGAGHPFSKGIIGFPIEERRINRPVGGGANLDHPPGIRALHLVPSNKREIGVIEYRAAFLHRHDDGILGKMLAQPLGAHGVRGFAAPDAQGVQFPAPEGFEGKDRR